MFINATLLVGLLAVSAPPSAGSRVYRISDETPRANGSAPSQPAVQQAPAASAPSDVGTMSLGVDCCPGRRCGHVKSGMHHNFCARGDMYPHTPYLAEPKNYYYFRPYQHFHIRDQQMEVLNYGGDPRNPYANDIFRRIYDEMDAEEIKPGEGPMPLEKSPPMPPKVPAVPSLEDPDAPPAPQAKSTFELEPASARRSVLKTRL